MAAKNKRGLGKGLDGIISNKLAPAAKAEAPAANGSPLMQEMADSITEHGIIEPLVVEPEGDHYLIVAGERRWRAANIAGLTEVPVVVREFSSPQEKLEAQIIENLQREDLDAIEEAKAFQRLKEEFKLTDDEVAGRVGKSRATITNSLRLLRLDGRVQQMVIDEQLSMGHARTLLAIEDADKQFETAQEAFDNGVSVRELEKLVKKLTSPEKEAKGKKKKEDLTQYQIHFDEYAERLAQRLGVKVAVSLKNKKQGRLEIDFYSTEDFDRFYERLSRDEQ